MRLRTLSSTIVTAFLLSGYSITAFAAEAISLQVQRAGLATLNVTITNSGTTNIQNLNIDKASGFPSTININYLPCSSPLLPGQSCHLLISNSTDPDEIVNTNLPNGISVVPDNNPGATQSLNVVAGTYLFAGGNFLGLANGTPTNNIAVWNGSTWSALMPTKATNSGVNGAVTALYYDNTHDRLYLGGAFTQAQDGTNLAHIATWDGNAFSEVGPGLTGTNAQVNAITGTQDNSKIFIGGNFSAGMDGTSLNNIAMYDPKFNIFLQLMNGSTNYNGVNNQVLALAYLNNILYLGGSFSATLSGQTLNNIASYDPASSSFGTLSGSANPGLNGSVYALSLRTANSSNYIDAGGAFNTANNTGTRLDNATDYAPGPNQFAPLGNATNPGLNNSVNAEVFAAATNTLILGGKFTNTSTNGTALNCVAAYTLGGGADFTPLPAGNPGIANCGNNTIQTLMVAPYLNLTVN
jgi:hypothetical protein